MKNKIRGTLAVMVSLALLIAPTLHASTLIVTSLADSGPGSLRDLVAASAPGDTIEFAINGTILLNSAITINHTLQVLGPGAAQLTVSGNFADRVFITAGNPVLLAGTTITDGLARGTNGADGAIFHPGQPGGDAYGGAILDTNSISDSLILSNCWVVRNIALGGAGGQGGADGPSATFEPPGRGGDGGYAHGGAVYTVGQISVLNCSFSSNRAIGGAGGVGGTDISGTPIINVTGGNGGNGGWAEAGAVLTVSDVTAWYQDSTFSLNGTHGGNGGAGGGATADPGGTGGDGGYGQCGAFKCGAASASITTFLSCTIVSNLAVAGLGGPGGSGTPAGSPGNGGNGVVGGICGGYSLACQACEMGNVVLADNFATTAVSNYNIYFTDLGFNFIGSADIAICSQQPSSQYGTILNPIHPLLGPLAQNGSGLPTHATTLTSPVIDAGFSFGLTTDERGAPRPYDFSSIPNVAGGDGSDIGAFELGNPDLGLGQVAGDMILSWPAAYGDFLLQSATNLSGSSNWVLVPDSPTVVGDRLTVTNLPDGASRFFRLTSYQPPGVN